MRALLLALAALSFFAVFSAFTEDMSDSIEDLSSGYYGLDDPTETTSNRCLSGCAGKHYTSKQCHCACKNLNGQKITWTDCKRACDCLHMSNRTCAASCIVSG